MCLDNIHLEYVVSFYYIQKRIGYTNLKYMKKKIGQANAFEYT